MCVLVRFLSLITFCNDNMHCLKENTMKETCILQIKLILQLIKFTKIQSILLKIKKFPRTSFMFSQKLHFWEISKESKFHLKMHF